ncbi:MAG: hypothetical protein AAB359_03655 [Elusimicrobiota bacterium]
MRKFPACLAVALLTFPVPALSQLPTASLPAPPQQMLEAMLLYSEQGDFDKAARVLKKMAPLLDELNAAYGIDLADGARNALKKGDAWEAQTAVLKVVYYHMKLELAAALKARGRQAVVRLRMAYLDYLFLAPRLKRKDKKLAAEVEKGFKSVHNLLASGRTAAGAQDEAAFHVREIERICLSSTEADSGQL